MGRPESEQKEVEEIVKLLLESQTVHLQDLRNKYQHDKVKMELMIHEARETVRLKHGIDFRPAPHRKYGISEVIERAEPGQIADRSRRGRKAGLKKLKRAQERMELAAEKTDDKEEKARLERAAEHQATQLLNAKVRSRRTATP